MDTSGMRASSIRPHRKNRTGCKTCKRRKIRCDEQKPSCTNCLKHSVRCDFADTPTNSTPATPSASTSYLSPTSADPTTDGPVLSPRPQTPSTLPDLNMLDLELMHNFATSTANSLNDSPSVRTIFRISVPKICLAHPFVMRAALALSALHIAHFTPSRRDHLIGYALLQHQAASQIASAVLANVTDENCGAIFIFSILTYTFAMATPIPADADDFLLVSDAGVADWIYLLRGTREIVMMNQATLQAGELGPMFSAGTRRYMLRLADTSPHEPLVELQSFLNLSIKDKERLSIYAFAIEEMRKTFSVVDTVGRTDPQITDFSIWVFSAKEEYLAMLKARDGVALVILAYYCVLLKKLECHWWVQGRSSHILSSIWRLVNEEHRLLMRWPMEEIGWLPGDAGTRRAGEDVGMTSRSG